MATGRSVLRECVQGASDAQTRFFHHVGVYLSGGDVGMAEQILHGADVGSGVEQVGGKAVAQGVRSHSLVQARGFDGLPNGMLERGIQHMMATLQPGMWIPQ